MMDAQNEFAVDLENRIVTHCSGASASFHEYETHNDWLASDVVILHNPDLYDGPEKVLARLAKETALKAGMPCRRGL